MYIFFIINIIYILQIGKVELNDYKKKIKKPKKAEKDKQCGFIINHNF